MLLRYFYDKRLAQASYLVGCQSTHEALVVDPARAVDQYIVAAQQEGLRIIGVTETHIHADFVSGSRELAERTGATLYLSDEGDTSWKYQYATERPHILLKDGDEWMIGNIRFQALHTPGHTPEHLSYLVTDTISADQPMGLFSGDFVFVGDVGRPDLLEQAAGLAGSAEPAARQLHRSLQRFRELPDYLQLWPAHGAGSACGKALGAVPSSTVGYEKLFNWALRIADEDEFVRTVLAGQPEPPAYFAVMKRVNKEGPPLLGVLRVPARLRATGLQSVLERGAQVVDTRPAEEYDHGFVSATINIPYDADFLTWMGALVNYEQPLFLIAGAQEIEAIVNDLICIGLDRIEGYFKPEAVSGWAERVGQLSVIPRVETSEIERLLKTGEAAIFDVRGAAEYEAGHIPDVPNLPLPALRRRLNEVPTDRPVVVHCASGARSAIAASVLRAAGVPQTINVVGGFDEWRAAGKPIDA
ncbi:MAG: MBL fold metallo-hydrolase [Ardenticatenaceae bacterium]|nr:MBL fold metallo-hydrolase [Ardenticatenaceae bacterium]HBY94299.1 MBL fold metallo-hydrolase [Chloroflexota bacterium]